MTNVTQEITGQDVWFGIFDANPELNLSTRDEEALRVGADWFELNGHWEEAAVLRSAAAREHHIEPGELTELRETCMAMRDIVLAKPAGESVS